MYKIKVHWTDGQMTEHTHIIDYIEVDEYLILMFAKNHPNKLVEGRIRKSHVRLMNIYEQDENTKTP